MTTQTTTTTAHNIKRLDDATLDVIALACDYAISNLTQAWDEMTKQARSNFDSVADLERLVQNEITSRLDAQS